ncbi:amino acid adenylation domain-containing protein [Pectobacterium versatile]|uniref:amino acid adenylation domain-containing protein n=1 Tax=Pectobacterium versatile TaxID=2488639 RepID=UPI002277CAF0|nr:amino acid adenylation domain-containing protein [Pectobacterium versatile]
MPINSTVENTAVLSYFLTQVSCQNTAPALVHSDNSMSYLDLHHASNAVANFLVSKGITCGDYVPIVAERNSNYIIALLGVMKLGAAYVPIDSHYPEKRKRYILDKVGQSFFLNTTHHDENIDQFSSFDINHIVSHYAPTFEIDNISGNDLAYVIFTSGTTGNPKGVMIEHHSLTTIVAWHNAFLSVNECSRSTLMAGVAFDVAQLEIWSPLIAGGTLVIPDEEIRLSTATLMDFFARQRLTHAFIPTAMVRDFIKQPLGDGLVLQHLFTAGEKLPSVETRGLPYALTDYYGPTETTIFATVNRVEKRGDKHEAHSIGWPIADTSIAILTPDGKPVEKGGIGELFISGSALARGYLNNEALAEEKFPFHPQLLRRVFRSGDLGRWLDDGRIQYLGRLDDQIKIRGNRIELSEIEEALLNHCAVSGCSVVATSPDNLAGRQLLAFVVANQSPFEAAALKQQLRETLPDYMVPAIFIPVAVIPLNPNGKIDKSGLRARYEAGEWSLSCGEQSGEYRAEEQQIAAIWRQVLGHEHFSYTDSFFDVGGHSLLAASLMKEIGEALQVRTWIRDIYENSHIQALASALAERKNTPEPSLDREPIRQLQEDVRLPEGVTFNRAEGMQGLATQRHILLTGVTGFVGIHLLLDLLNSGYADIHCPVRRTVHADSEERLNATLEKYALGLSALQRRRVHLYHADLAEPHLGMNRSDYIWLVDNVDAIYHSASAVNFIQPYSWMKRDNVQGLIELVRFAGENKTKALILLSTISVYSWGHLYTHKRVMYEHDDIGQNIEAVITDIGYVRSKWVMESIADLAASQGLPLITFRLGYATYHSQSGACASYQWWGRLVQTCIESGTIPDLHRLYEGLTSVDYMTSAICWIARNPKAVGKKFNLIHAGENNLTLKAFFRRLEETFGYSFTPLPYAQWLRSWEKDRNAHLYPLLSLFKDNMYDGKSTVELYQDTYQWDCANVKHFLQGSGIEEPRFSRQELHAYLAWLQIPLAVPEK